MDSKESVKNICQLLGIITNTENEKYLYEDIVSKINELKDSLSNIEFHSQQSAHHYEAEINELKDSLSDMEFQDSQAEDKIRKLEISLSDMMAQEIQYKEKIHKLEILKKAQDEELNKLFAEKEKNQAFTKKLKYATAYKFAEEQYTLEPALEKIYWISPYSEDTSIIFLEVTASTPASSSIETFKFGTSTEFSMIIAEITPSELATYKENPHLLPPGWDLTTAICIDRKEK
jgi:predicted nuclease with TOPRIM domain